MSQRTVSTVASIMLSASVFAVQGCVRPDPVVELPAPSAGGRCAESVAAALTRLADGQTLQCRNDSGEYRWESFTDPYPNSDRWVSAGSGLTLSGQGRRNPEMLSGKWIGYPLDPAARCRAERSEEHTSELQSRENLVCRLLLEKKKKNIKQNSE